MKIFKHLLVCLFTSVMLMSMTTLCPFSQTAHAQDTLEDLMNEVDEELGTALPPHTQTNTQHLGASTHNTNDHDNDAFNTVPRNLAKKEAPHVDETHAKKTHAKKTGPSGLFWFGLFGIIITAILLGLPLYVLIGSVTLYLLMCGGVFKEFRLLASIIEQTRSLSDKEVLLAIPFFVVSGALMTKGDIATRLIRFAQVLFGRLPGGLAISAVFACAFFAAISGSSPVTVIAIGSIMYPALIKQGYPEDFSIGLVTSGGSLGILIPPSIPMIIYAIVDPTGLRDPVGYQITTGGGTESGVTDLFLAGMGPAGLIALALAFYAYRQGLIMRDPEQSRFIPYLKFFACALLLPIVSPLLLIAFAMALIAGAIWHVNKNSEKNEQLRARINFDVVELWSAFTDGFWALFLPVLILGGIYSGLFTPTEAAAVAVVYAAFIEIFVHRSLTLEDIPWVFTESVILMGSLFVIIALALGFNMYLDRAKIPEAAVEMILQWDLSIISFLLIVNMLLLIVGFFMDILSAILILVPLLAPIAFGLGIHPLHLAIVFIVNLEIGYLTPPIGLNLFVASTLFKKGIGEVVRSVLPFVTMMLCCLLVVTYVPTLSLGPVALLKGQSPFITFPERSEQAKDQAKAKAKEIPAHTHPERKKKSDQKNNSKAKTLDELMNEVDDDVSDTQGGDVSNTKTDAPKTLDELMNEVDNEVNNESSP